MKRSLIVLWFVSAMFLCDGANAAGNIGGIPIQHHGRIKPFSAFAQETLQFVSGKSNWHRQDASVFFLADLEHPHIFLDLPLILVDHPGLKQLLQLRPEVNNFSYQQIKPAFHTLEVLVQAAAQKREKDERLSVLEQQAEVVYQRVTTVQHLGTGELITVIPVTEGAWLSPYKVSGLKSVEFKKLATDCAAKLPTLDQSVAQWQKEVEPLLAKGMSVKLRMETAYYMFQPFYYTGIFYFLGFVSLLLAKPFAQGLGMFLVMAGFTAHTNGILLRWLILERPPVANMYETIIFMDWVLMLMVGIFVVIKNRQSLLSSGAFVSALGMLYARLLPMDQSLDILSPVLRSSYWLMVQEIMIISSYSLFAFAMAVAHRHLFLSVRGKMTPQEDQLSAHTIDRLLQAGQIALVAGTILGGVLANEACGRFWGLNPKETWAVITFLGYMTVLHLRYSKKLNNFALAAGAILGFLLVVMSWYGMNFVLGRGMHSYGPGSGGLQWIVCFLVFEACFLGFVFFKRKM